MALAVGFAGCVTLPRPAPPDVERAQARFPGLTLDQLDEGRRLYSSNCSSCHALYSPSSRAASEWPGLIDRMVGVNRAKIAPEDRLKIERYLITFAK